MVAPAIKEGKKDASAIPARMFRSERQANFRTNVRKEVIAQGKTKKDEERRRMEEYRKLCKKEGVVSSRLQEYDEQRTKAEAMLDERLQQVDSDLSLSNAERRRRKFALKQKQASTPVAELAKQRKPSAMIGVEKLQAARAAEREEAQRQRAAQEAEKRQKIAARRKQQELHSMKTRKGQPVMSGKIGALMAKLEKR